MKPDLQRRVQRYGWDKAADHYEPFWQQQLQPAQDLLLRMASLSPGEHVLDIACGTGLVSIPAAEAVLPDGTVTGVDLSDGMVEGARRVAADHGVENLSFSQMDAEDLDFPDDAFHVVLCSLGLMYVPDPARAIAEMHRVTRPGGRTVASVWGERKRCGWADVFPIVDQRVKTDVCPLFFQLGTADALADEIRAAGFADVVAERLPTRLHYASGDDACGAAFVGGPVALAYDRFDEATRSEVHQEYLASIKAYRDGDGYDVPGEFVVVSGVKQG